ncbi:MAG: sigma-54-dependent transcriptional regulator [Pirellulales bacterium]
MSHVLVVDDEDSICWALRRLLREDGHDVCIASSAEEAYRSAQRQRPDLVIIDVRLPGEDGLSAMPKLSALIGAAPIVVMTAFGNLETAVAAVRQGAFDYLTKPFDIQRAASVVAAALARRDKPALLPPTPADATREELIGQSSAMQEVFKRIALVAPQEASALVTGESGTGKELVARAIHRHSARGDGPLVPVNLAALSPTLVESELFGHAKGAFTGADHDRRGLLELAQGGTIFFDEVADIPLPVQVKLLRVLEQHEVTPVGDTRSRPIDSRVVAATHRDLRAEVREGRFRADLYFRLAVVEIAMPPLRERTDDIPLLAERFLARLGAKAGLTTAAQAELARRPWPGNVRELRNAIEHGALLARGGAIGPEHLPPGVCLSSGAEQSLAAVVRAWADQQLAQPALPTDLYQQFLAEAEPALIAAALDKTGDNRMAAADLLGIHRATLRKKLDERAGGMAGE